MSKIKIILLDEQCMPEKKYKWDAGWDLKAAESVTINPGEVAKVPTGIHAEIPARFCGMVVPRSGLGTKHQITLANDVGIIDSDYRGQIMVFLVNHGKEAYTIEQYDRFAQLLIVPINLSDLWVVEKLSNTNRGDGGFGSTGNKTQLFGEDEVPEDEVRFKNPPLEESINKKEKAEKERQKKLDELKKLKPGEYVKLKKSGKLFDLYPIATGDMKQDLGL
jgi:dUTP pyrophosphatase